MRQIGEDLWRLGSHGHNWYLFTDGDVVTVVDAGCSREWGTLTGGLQQLGLPLEAIAAFIITHSHADHFGLAKQARDHDLRVAVHEDEESRANGTYTGRYAVAPQELPLLSLPTLRNFAPMMVKGVMSLAHVDDAETFVDGQTLDVPGHPVVVHTPGHTEGHAMFHMPDRGVLFTGDGLVTMDLLSRDTSVQMLDRRFHHDDARAHESLDRIVDLEADVLLPGHGNPWMGSPRAAVEIVRNG